MNIKEILKLSPERSSSRCCHNRKDENFTSWFDRQSEKNRPKKRAARGAPSFFLDQPIKSLILKRASCILGKPSRQYFSTKSGPLRPKKYYFQHQDLHLIIITHHTISPKSGFTTAFNTFPVQNISYLYLQSQRTCNNIM